MYTYTLKNKETLKKYEDLFKNFSEKLDYYAKAQLNDCTTYVTVYSDEKDPAEKQYTINISKSEIKKVEPLKPYVWYSKDDFDKNPKGYHLVEEAQDGDLMISAGVSNDCLWEDTKRFMYLEKE